MKSVILTPGTDLPRIPMKIDFLYGDFETTSRHRKKDSLNPWRNCWPAGFCFTWDNMDTAFYLPIEHHDEKDQCFPQWKDYIQNIFNVTEKWVNHNIKYDAHVAYNAGLFYDDCTLVDTLTLAKLVESDRYGYSEDALIRDWLKAGKNEEKEAFLPWLDGNKDWGEIPIRLMGPYGCRDVLRNRELYHYIVDKLSHGECNAVAATEIDLTSVLVRVERQGMRIDEQRIKVDCIKAMQEMVDITEEIQKETGIIIRPNVNADCYELFHGKYGLPIVKYTNDDEKKAEPSYDKYALATLLTYPTAPQDILKKVLRYRHLESLTGFHKQYLELNIDGILHPWYNQCVRSGRKSCSLPNMQQLMWEAKFYIIPPKGHVFISNDFSSIEFRLISHYLNQPEIIKAYYNNPDTDFHQWVADMCHTKRDPAKTINFTMAFGGGKGRVLSNLASNADIIAEIKADSNEEFERLCQMRAEMVFTDYHDTLYRLKPLTYQAANVAKSRGYVRNLHGRRRHLPGRACYKAFNSIIQSEAADIMKEAVVSTSPLYNDDIEELGIEQVGFVHDEILSTCPIEALPPGIVEECEAVIKNESNKKKRILPHPCRFSTPTPVQKLVEGMIAESDRYRIPLRVDSAICPNNWAESCSLPNELKYITEVEPAF